MADNVSHECERRTRRLNLRATERQEKLIRMGAELRGVPISEFILENACRQAEQDLADRRQFTVSEEQYQAFLDALDSSPQDKPRLSRLLSEKSVLDR
jgi:uncharacterized protein (DUF1778 family)